MGLLAIVKLLSDKESSTVLACVCEGNVFEDNTNISRQPLGSKSLISGVLAAIGSPVWLQSGTSPEEMLRPFFKKTYTLYGQD